MASYKNALVTGGAGFIGSHLVQSLIEKGLDVAVLDNLLTGKKKNLPKNARLVVGDIRDAECVHRVLAENKIDIIFHQAARVTIRGSIDQFMEDADVNLVGTLTVLEALKKSSVNKLIFASSMAVYADKEKQIPILENHLTQPLSPYGIAKLAAERYCQLICQKLSIDCVILRYFNTYGPRQTNTPYVGVTTIFINNLLKREPLKIYGDGKQVRDFVHVEDVVQANTLAMETEIRKGIFNVGTGRGTSVNKIAKRLIQKLAPDIGPQYVPAVLEELRYSVANIRSIQKTLGFTPRYPTFSPDDVIQYWKATENR